MTPKSERIYRPEYARELIAIAEGDLDSAKGLRKINEGRPEDICCLAQQCVEKSLKAVFCSNGKAVPLVHDLDVLIAKLPAELQPPEFGTLGELSLYASVRRHEEGVVVLGDDDLDAAIATGILFLEWAKTQVRA